VPCEVNCRDCTVFSHVKGFFGTTLIFCDQWLMSHFCLPRHVRLQLCHDLEPQLKRKTQRSNTISVPVQLLSTLGVLATGTFQREIGDRSGLSQPTISRSMPAVLAAIKSISARYIQFPYDDAQQTPPSMNDVCSEYGSPETHNSFIFQNCSVGTSSLVKQFDVIPLGDKGYPLTEYLITPLANPQTEQERRFNSMHTRTRTTVERCVGLLKGRWLCLESAGRTLLYTPEKASNIIMACGVLHNIALENGVPFNEVQPHDPMPRDLWPQQPPLGALQRRQDLILHF
uniref:Putative nuclease HARBI1 n=1 Tax=Sander lucioperca TaxID=283035 RepID=A0A8C9ZE55_SANLU